MSFHSIAPYLKDPLVLSGFALLLFFGLCRSLIKSGLLPQVTQKGSLLVLRRVILYGFILAIVIILLGFGLKYREMSRREQIAAVQLIANELKSDKAIIGSIAANTATALETGMTVALALRQSSPILREMFPYQNLETKATTPSAHEMAMEQMRNLLASGLPAQQLELDRMNAAARAIRGTIIRTRPALQSLADSDHRRYPINRKAWLAELPVLRRISVVDVTDLEKTYTALELTRNEYDVLLRYQMDYFAALSRFLEFDKSEITDDSLAEILAAERQYFAVARAYGKNVTDRIVEANTAVKHLQQAVDELQS